ncbi:hypothetical protein ACU686_23620 [Yinghuangia aomiensis]
MTLYRPTAPPHPAQRRLHRRARRAIDSPLRHPGAARGAGRRSASTTARRGGPVRGRPWPRRAAEAAEDRAAALWNAQHDRTPSGGRPAPLNLAALDADTDITASITELEEAVHDRLGYPAPPAGDVISARLIRILRLLDVVERDADLAEHVQSELRRMARRCASRPRRHRADPGGSGRAARCAIRCRCGRSRPGTSCCA